MAKEGVAVLLNDLGYCSRTQFIAIRNEMHPTGMPSGADGPL